MYGKLLPHVYQLEFLDEYSVVGDQRQEGIGAFTRAVAKYMVWFGMVWLLCIYWFYLAQANNIQRQYHTIPYHVGWASREICP